jgi:hypothetical protein
MQDNATAHTANNSVVALDEVFGEQIIGCGLWPPRLPDLNTCNFYLWGSLKGKVYVNNPHFLEKLQSNIRNEIFYIPVQHLRHVSRNIFSLCEACFEAEGHHFETLLKKSVKNCSGKACRAYARSFSCGILSNL